MTSLTYSRTKKRKILSLVKNLITQPRIVDSVPRFHKKKNFIEILEYLKIYKLIKKITSVKEKLRI